MDHYSLYFWIIDEWKSLSIVFGKRFNYCKIESAGMKGNENGLVLEVFRFDTRF